MTAVAAVAPKRFRLSELIPPETDIQEAVCEALDLFLLPPAQWCAMPVGHIKLSPAQAGRLQRIGTKRSWPDIQVVYDGRIYGVEMKKPGGRLSRTRIERTRRGSARMVIGQAEMFELLRQAGMAIAVCDTVEGVLCALAAWQIPIRRQS